MKLHKSEVAKQQIHTAIDLFFIGTDNLSVVTLAGAAEEIIGDLLKRDGKHNMIDHLKGLDKKLSDGGRQFDIVNKEINGFKNNLKHARRPDDDVIDVSESQVEAMAMLMRAITNFQSYMPPSQKMLEYVEWLQKNKSRRID